MVREAIDGTGDGARQRKRRAPAELGDYAVHRAQLAVRRLESASTSDEKRMAARWAYAWGGLAAKLRPCI